MNGDQEPVWLCSIDGYHPNNRRSWCGAGCGSDYRHMIKIEGLAAIELRELGERVRELAVLLYRNGNSTTNQGEVAIYFHNRPQLAAQARRDDAAGVGKVKGRG